MQETTPEVAPASKKKLTQEDKTAIKMAETKRKRKNAKRKKDFKAMKKVLAKPKKKK